MDAENVKQTDGQPLKLNDDLDAVALPDLHIAMKEGASLRFCAQGTTANVDHNNIYLDPAAYVMGPYDKALDPVPDTPDPEPEGNDSSEPSGPAPDSAETEAPAPDTGSPLPAAALLTAAVAGGAVLTLRGRKRRSL